MDYSDIEFNERNVYLRPMSLQDIIRLQCKSNTSLFERKNFRNEFIGEYNNSDNELRKIIKIYKKPFAGKYSNSRRNQILSIAKAKCHNGKLMYH